MDRKYLKQIIGYAAILDIIILDQLSKWAVLEYILKPAGTPDAEKLGLIEWSSTTQPKLPPVSATNAGLLQELSS